MEKLYQKLWNYSNSDYYGFHMPGHKRNKELMKENFPFEIDITEIEGFDDLHHPREILKEYQDLAKKIYKSKAAYFLVNGSTVGILAAIASVAGRGETLLVARNVHKSVYNALELFDIRPEYILPKNGMITAEEVQDAIAKNPQIKGLVMVSPTYEGIVSDIQKIAGVLHESGLPLILDEAHGAHFGFHPIFPKSGNELGADLVIQSLHKTLPALTQTGLLHVNGQIVSSDKVKKYLSMLQSSSPSYVLMSSICSCLDFLKEKSQEAFFLYGKNLKKLREELRTLRHLKLLEGHEIEPSKIVISTKGTNLSAKKLYEILYETYHLQMEMTGADYVLGMTSVGDTVEGFERLKKALVEIDQELQYQEETENEINEVFLPEVIFTPGEASQKPGENCMLQDCKGRIAKNSVYLYPPGIPILVPGERITKAVYHMLLWYSKNGYILEGLKETEVEVVKNE